MGVLGGRPQGVPRACSLLFGSPQHFALLLKYLIHVAIPDIPGWVAEEMAKLEYQRREAFKVCRPGRSWRNLSAGRGALSPGPSP